MPASTVLGDPWWFLLAFEREPSGLKWKITEVIMPPGRQSWTWNFILENFKSDLCLLMSFTPGC